MNKVVIKILQGSVVTQTLCNLKPWQAGLPCINQ